MPGRHVTDERGASAVEYALLLAAIAAIIVIAVFGLGGLIRSTFDNTSTSLDCAANGPC